MIEKEKTDVLLVEDSPQDSELTIRALKKNNIAATIKWLKDGAEALDYIYCRGPYQERPKDTCPRVILLDLQLPKVDGFEVLQEIKKEPCLKSIPVIIITSSAEISDIEKAYNLGANSYVVKPVNYEHFNETVKHIGHYWLNINQFIQ